MNERHVTYRRRLLGLLLAGVILIPSLLGFGNKFLELIRIYRGDADGAFAVAPITNYILASTGFLLLFLFGLRRTACFATSSGPSTRCWKTSGVWIARANALWSGSTRRSPMSDVDGAPAEVENQFHNYTTNRIPWYVRMVWIGFWCFAVYYTIRYLFPICSTS